MSYINEIVSRIEEIINIEKNIIRNSIDISKENELWKYSIACFKFNKLVNMKPNILARYLYENFRSDIFNVEIINDIYLNFFIKKSLLGERIIEEIILKKEKPVEIYNNINKNICISSLINDSSYKVMDYNIISIVIGQYLKNIFTKCGCEIDFIGYINDYNITDKSKIFKEIDKYNSIFNINFTYIEEKSEYIDKEDIEVIKHMTNYLKTINGLEVLSLEKYNMAPYPIYDKNKIIDLDMLYNRTKKYNKYIEIAPNNRITMIKQKIKALETMDNNINNNLHILSYEIPKFQYENILQKYIDTLNVDMYLRSNIDSKEKEIIDSIKYIIIKNIDNKNIYLDYEHILGREKGTLKYILDIKVKIKDILRCNKYSIDNINFEDLEDNRYPLLNLLYEFKNILIEITETLMISKLNRYLLDIINNFNKLYNYDKLKSIKTIDLILIEAVGIVIDDVLEIMGIEKGE